MRKISGILLFAMLVIVSRNSFAQMVKLSEVQKAGSQSINTMQFADISVEVEGGKKSYFFKPSDREDILNSDLFRMWRYTNLEIGQQWSLNLIRRQGFGGSRLLVCVAVDGRHVNGGEMVKGDLTSLTTWDQAGSCHIMNKDVLNIYAWRGPTKSDLSEAYKFKVTDFSQSVAGKFGDEGGKGTIVFAVFSEKSIPIAGSKGAGGYGETRGAGSRSIGTGLGDRVNTKVSTVTDFVSEEKANTVIAIKYFQSSTLKKMGYTFPSENRMW